VAAISLRGKPASRDELFVRGATQLFGPPLYLRARFLLPWVHPKTLDGQPEEIRRTVAVARFSGMSAVAALALLLAALEHARAHAH
jgi:hypothetical protein